MPSSEDRNKSLQDWIQKATVDLTGSAKVRLAEEYEDHYADAYGVAIEARATEDDAHSQAISSLGDAGTVHRASIPVHGDPYRLRAKALLFTVGAALLVASAFYRQTLLQAESRSLYTFKDVLEQGDIEAIIDRIEEGAVLDDSDGFSPLHLALIQDYGDDRVVKIFRILLENGADPDVIDRNTHYNLKESLIFDLVDDGRPIEYYSDNNAPYRTDLLKLLISHEVDIDSKSRMFNFTIMEYASLYKDTAIVDKLRTLGAHESPEALIYQGRCDEVLAQARLAPGMLTDRYVSDTTILHLLAYKGCASAVGQALELGADPNAVSRHGMTALHYALFGQLERGDNPSPELLSLLLQGGCDINQKEISGCTPLFLAARGWGYKEVKFLLDHGADPNIPGYENLSPLMGAIDIFRVFKVDDAEEVALALIESGANVNHENDVHATALHYAMWTKNYRVIRALVEAGASLETMDDDGNMPIHLVCDGSYPHAIAILDLLLELGADINAQSNLFRDSKGFTRNRTPLFMAYRDNNLELSRYLLEHGADPTISDISGRTVLETDDKKFKALFAEFGFDGQ
jgi:ankyrin repeat protein